LENRSKWQEAFSEFRLALDLSSTAKNDELILNSLRGLFRTGYQLGPKGESDHWFDVLVKTGKATAWDWRARAGNLNSDKRQREAGAAYQTAAETGGAWTNWCDAETQYAIAGGLDDAVLRCARKCIELGTSQKKSERYLNNAHFHIANVLIDRGVYEEAFSHAQDAIALDPTDAFAYHAQAIALRGLQRNQEAVNSAKQAVRLSDGKYSNMHFTLGQAYFYIENFQMARQSFEKAAQLDPKDDSAAYNVAICNLRLHLNFDAATWYEEALRRNPNRSDKSVLLREIASLRQ
jgi:tetratricopeptide (TPR) repeat protein